MLEAERSLWERHLELKRAVARAEQRGSAKDMRKFEEALHAVEDVLFARWRTKADRPKPTVERFSYRVPVVDGETGRVLGYHVADQDGIHRPACHSEELPENSTEREWLRAIDDSRYAREKAALTWRSLGHTGRPRCVGCLRRKELAYLEFRNWDDDARFKIPHVMAVCSDTATSLLRRSRREFFGVTALGTRVAYPCRAEAEEAPQVVSLATERRPVRRHADGNRAAAAKARASLAEKRCRSREAG